MELTYKERIQLSIQLKILEKVDPENRKNYELYREAIENGYEIMYGNWLYPEVDTETVSVEKSKLVGDILTMFSSLYYSYKSLKDKEGLTTESVKFRGFDGNNECEYMSYALFLINKLNRFTDLKKTMKDDLNAHMPTIDNYRNMLVKYNKIPIEKRGEMTAEQIKGIINTRD